MKSDYGKEIKEIISAEAAPENNGGKEADSANGSATVELKELIGLKSTKKFVKKLKKHNISVSKISKVLDYERELRLLQIELVKLQRWVRKKGKRVAIVFEGHSASGRGGAIQCFFEHLNPRSTRIVALPKPGALEKGQWYFQRYVNQLPNRGELILFNRSWYNRAVIEPVNGFCTTEQYERYMQQVPEFEHMLIEDGIDLVKFWFSISKEEHAKRIKSRQTDPLMSTKIGSIDSKSQKLWGEYSEYKERMFSRSNTKMSPWIIVRANNKRKAHLESIRYVLANTDYKGRKKAGISLVPDPEIIQRFHRSVVSLD